MKKLANQAFNENHPNYQLGISRLYPMYTRQVDIRDEFERDYTRILFSKAYRRLKHKTQVFFAVSNDHVCTRLEHVNLVCSVSESIAEYLGLNTHLVKSIALGHDLGHAPFGHGGEKIINRLYQQYHLGTFFHEKNSLYFVDHIEQLKDNQDQKQPLNLTYAVRDGIVCHCGEVKLKNIKPRSEYIDLNDYQKAGQYEPFTYEGCVVKMADKIAYLSRDIEDALMLELLTKEDIDKLIKELKEIDDSIVAVDNGNLIHYFITDICLNSSVEQGISLSDQGFAVMNHVMNFNYKNIYLTKRLSVFSSYVENMIQSIFDLLMETYHQDNLDKMNRSYPTLMKYFREWLDTYKDSLYDLNDQNQYARAVLDYISGMTDTYILKSFNEIVSF